MIPEFWTAVSITMTRGGVGFALASVLGLVLGILVARSRILRATLAQLGQELGEFGVEYR